MSSTFRSQYSGEGVVKGRHDSLAAFSCGCSELVNEKRDALPHPQAHSHITCYVESGYHFPVHNFDNLGKGLGMRRCRAFGSSWMHQEYLLDACIQDYDLLNYCISSKNSA